MTPKEKAKELVEKMKPYVYCFMGSGMLTNTYDANVANDYAKICALISVDEIISANVNVSYWADVKLQINKL